MVSTACGRGTSFCACFRILSVRQEVSVADKEDAESRFSFEDSVRESSAEWAKWALSGKGKVVLPVAVLIALVSFLVVQLI